MPFTSETGFTISDEVIEALKAGNGDFVLNEVCNTTLDEMIADAMGEDYDYFQEKWNLSDEEMEELYEEDFTWKFIQLGPKSADIELTFESGRKFVAGIAYLFLDHSD